MEGESKPWFCLIIPPVRDPEHAVEAGLRLECEGASGVLVDVYHGLVLDRWLSVGCSYHM